ncbi:hypothetical protein PF010_g16369 [Phytophthora fragariae]|uniref:RxLR effector protein n=1 Tax=Phytophthora fragariae TaxID=53985 RepID=A0A6A3XQ02_9STRA|nr:hypothetical protein PF010_g16369 [Phytophthora fragariae]KAE9205216.1 hypothetical protein PF002_g20396 [Phytophthora fragariae]KAE9213778.1 hypothetical protein PF004_g15237 [Phytophthora fragariae]
MAHLVSLAFLTSGGISCTPVGFRVLCSTLNLSRNLSKSRSGEPRGLLALNVIAKRSDSSLPSGSIFSTSARSRSASAIE